MTEHDILRAEVERLTKALDVCSSVHAHNVKLHKERERLRAEVVRLRLALEQVLVDINDPHPRMATLEGYRDAMRATENMARAALDGKETP